MSDRWLANKLGFVNFWYYDEEEFDLSDGKLLLRGSNGSGKSVTMQSCIPLLLDGNKRPERIDPFGTNARKIENYLIMYDDENERTAYLYIEFKKANSERYLTIGMGLKAVRGKNVDAWYFIINDGRRIKKDFPLYIDKGYEKTPLTKKELQNRIGEGGEFIEGQGEYKNKVNEYLFGYTDIENYEELVDLLINIRSPKLSKDFKPTVIYEILENSLRQLTEEDLRPMSEAMENMDNLKLRIEQLEDCHKSVKQIEHYYSKYNNYILHEKARRLSEKFNDIKSLRREKEGFENTSKELHIERSKIQEENLRLKEELSSAQNKIDEYLSSDVKETKEKLENIKTDIGEITKEKEEKSKEHEDKKNKLGQKESQQKALCDDIEVIIGEKEKTLNEMDDFAEECSFKSHDIFKDDLNISFIKEAFTRHRIKIKKSKEVLNRFENKKNELEDALLQRDRKEKEVDDLKSKLNEAEEYLTTVKEEQIEKIVKWNTSNSELLLMNEAIQTTTRRIMQLEEYSQITDINQAITDIYNEKNAVLKNEKEKTSVRINGFKEECEDLNLKIKELQNMKEIEFNRDDEVIRNREKLKKIGIPFIPLYKAIDFNNELTEETKENIESSLVDMGILDALVIPKKYKEQVLSLDRPTCDKYLFSEPVFLAHSILQYLRVDSSELNEVKYGDVDYVLQSILLDKGSSTYIDEMGNYGLGILKGKTRESYQLKYIGETSRKKHRERAIEELNNQKQLIEQQIAVEEKVLESINNRIGVLEQEYKSLPNYEDLKKALELINECSSRLRIEEVNLGIIFKKFEEVELCVKELKKEVYEITEGLEIKKSYKAFNDAEEASNDYGDRLSQFESLNSKLKGKEETLKTITENIDELNGDIDRILYELNKKTVMLREKETQRTAYEEALAFLGYKDIEKELEKCYEIVNKNPKEIEDNKEKIIKFGERIKNNDEKAVEKEKIIEEETKLLSIYENIFIEEYNLGYVTKYETEKSSIGLCKNILSITQETTNKSKESYDNELFDSFSKNSGTLRDYQPRLITIFQKDIIDEKYSDVILSSERKDIRFRVNGKEVAFKVLADIISKEIEENKILLSDKEKEFFQDILLKTISNKIRAKIHHSRNWVNKMNELMQSMNTSSSFKLTLKWVAKKAENEAQMDTKKLIDILEKDSELIRQEDIDSLSKHFSSKVKEIIRNCEDNGERKNYHTVIKEILDYRKWYEFELHSKKEGEKEKELTNNAFFQLSGGEKAMAMYIPLFTAVYSRYDMADKKDCPRIVALDEAFAGVDEDNIRDMFRILKEMKLDYILNSQVLWGDYDTVENLAIAEIIRPDNSDIVTVLRYHWNGVEKQYLV